MKLNRTIFYVLTSFACASFEQTAMAQPLSFGGYTCSSDCSGHIAGFNWASARRVKSTSQCTGNSNSFREGCFVYVLKPLNGNVEGRWLTGFGQGTSEAVIYNKDGAQFGIYCQSGVDGQSGVIFAHSDIKSLRDNTVLFVEAGGVKKYFETQNGSSKGTTRMQYSSLKGLVDALKTTSDEAFYFKIPSSSKNEVFSLRGARQALASVDLERCQK